MKLLSSITVGLFATLSVISLPGQSLDQDVQIETVQAVKPTIVAVKHQKPKLQAKMDLHDILNKLQTQVSLQKSDEQPIAVKPVAAASATAKGIKQVEVESQSAESQYSIPNGDIFLDRSAVGEMAPADDTVR